MQTAMIMESHLLKVFYSIFIISSVIKATGTTDLGTNDTLSEDRQPRVIGRIVKLYSGAHPEPVYCSQEGFQADLLHCAIFYRCVRAASGRYTVFRFQCGPGTIYDPDVETCNFPQRTKRTNCGGYRSKQSEIPQSALASPELPSPITARPLYTNNLNGLAKNTISTAYPWATTPSQKLQSPLQSASTEYLWNTPTSQIASTKIVASKDGGEPCIEDGFMGDRQDCRKFYRCVGNQRGGFIRYEFSCSDSTVWDEDAQNCNHAWAVQRSRCGRINTNLEKNLPQSNDVSGNKDNIPNTVQEQLQVSYGNKVSQTQTQISQGPVKQNQTQINYSNHENTDQSSRVKQNQTQISYGSAISQTQTQINHGDSAVQTQLQIDHTKDTSQTQTTVTNVDADDSNQGYGNQPVETTNTEQSSSTGNNKNECTQSGFMGDSNDCNRFYRCVDNGRGGFIKYDFTCGEGTVWDSNIESCNHAWAVPKCGRKEPENSSPQAVTQTTTTTKVTESPQTTQNSAATDDNEDHGYDSQKPQQELSSSTTELSHTNTKPNEGNKCNSSGFMGDKNNCKKFYRCVDNGNGAYTRYEFSCGEGTVWDSKIEACNHAWAVEKCGEDDSDIYKETTSSAKPTMYDEMPETTNDIDSGYPHQSSSSESSLTNPTEPTSKPTEKLPPERPTAQKECTQEGFVGDEEDCKKFYRCVNNGHSGFIKYEFSCGEGTIWDSEITACNHPNSVKRACSGETSNQMENITETSQNTSSGTEATSTTEESVPPNNPPSTAPSSEECTQEGFMGDDKDCKKFYRCVNNGKGGYTKYDFTCGDKTVWNQELQTCDHETRHKNCSKGSINESQTIQSTTGTTEQQSSSTETNAQPTPKPDSSYNETRAKCTSEGFYANPNDCKKFYRCVDNGKGRYIKYDFACGDGTIWVQEIQACDHDTDGTCSSSQSEQSTEAENGSKPQYTSTSTESTAGQPPDKQEDEKPEDSSNLNNNYNDEEKCSSEGFYANKEDCRKFYRCVDNGNGGFTKHDFTCGEGTAWDSDLQTCNHIDQVKSCQGQENQSKPESDESTTTTSSPTDNSLQSSTSGETATETSKPANKAKCEQEGYYGNPEDCTKFYRCVDNGKGGFTKYDFDCGEGTIWDQDVQTCNHPQDVANPSCQQNAGSESSSTSSTTASSSSSSSSTTTSTTESNNGSDCSTKKPAKSDVNCTKAGYYPDPNDCKKFYRCVDWDGNGEKFSVYHFECGEGTIWDPALDTCNHEDSVYPPRDCSGPQSQSENSGEESTTSQTTTEQSTTAPPQTVQTTAEQTATQQTNPEESTTSPYTTPSNEVTTTEQNTDGTTAQQTEQSTTEKTTTQKLTTSEQTEQTTKQESTTSDQSETTTTQHIEETTTEQSTSSSDQTTTQHTTEQTTTQESTTSESTTEQSTTEQSTMEQSTTEQSTTEQSTTEHSSNTTENTTQELTEGTTQESTTGHTTTTQTDDSGTTESYTSTTESSEELTTENGGDQTTESPSSEKECPKTEDDQNLFMCPTSFKRHPKYCNMFYQCTEDDDTHDVQVATFRCPNETIYDESQTKCVEEKKAEKKCDGEIAQKRRIKRFDTVYKEPITISNERLKCPAPGHYPFEKENCSPAFLKCKTNKSGVLRGYVHQCPQNYFYWSVSRRCEHKDHVKDCKKSYNDWSGRWEIPIERRNVAP